MFCGACHISFYSGPRILAIASVSCAKIESETSVMEVGLRRIDDPTGM